MRCECVVIRGPCVYVSTPRSPHARRSWLAGYFEHFQGPVPLFANSARLLLGNRWVLGNQGPWMLS